MFPNEAEILFPPNSKFKIKEVLTNSSDYKGTIIKCETVAFDKRGVGFTEFADHMDPAAKKLDIKKQLLDVIKPKKQLYPNLDLNTLANASMEKCKLTDEEIKQLLLTCRFKFVSPQRLV